MPKAKHQDAIARQWEILKYLPRKGPGKTTNEIVKALEYKTFSVTKRTIERDLNELSRLFSLICNEDNKPYKWYWVPGKGEEFPALTLTDALSLKIIEDVIKPLIPHAMLETLEHRFNEANNKLATMSAQNKNASWLNKVRNVSPALPLLPPKINDVVLDAVQTALLNDKQIEIEYQGAEKNSSRTQILHPLALVQRGPTTYLVATAYEYDDIRLYAIHRIKKTIILGESVSRPKDFSIDKYIAEGRFGFGSCKKIKLEAYISEWLFTILEETPLSLDQKIVPDGDWSLLTATIEDTWQLHWWLLSQGNGIEVIKPKKLRKLIKAELADTLEQYT